MDKALQLKACTLCNEKKPLAEFNENKRYKDGYYKHCKQCHYSVYGRNAHYKRAYGLSETDYNTQVEQQNYSCAVCNTKAEEGSKWKRLVVDHCHETGEVRGILCQPCNMALGSARDNPNILRKLAAYLEEFYDKS